MAVSLGKGGNVRLSKEDLGLAKILIGMGGDMRSTDGIDFDLDANAFLLAAEDKVRADGDFIFYNHLKADDGSIEHTGENMTGEVYRHNEEWKFRAMGQGYQGGLAPLAREYDVNIG